MISPSVRSTAIFVPSSYVNTDPLNASPEAVVPLTSWPMPQSDAPMTRILTRARVCAKTGSASRQVKHGRY